MAVQQVGLRAVFDIGGFASNVNTYINSLNVVQNANAALAGSSRSLGTALSAGIGGAIGAGAVTALNQLSGALRTVGADVFETLKFFEQLTFSLETMFAIQGKNAGTFDTVTQGLEQTSQAAQEYLLWLQDLAIFSPFTTEQIASGNQLLQVYRFTAQEAAGLTKLFVDFASAAGRSPESLNRISLAVGQIRTEGRLLARDALQLTQAGIPIYDFLADYTGQTVQSLLKLQEKGLLPARTAIEALVAGLKDFEGSGKRVAGTISGLFSSLEDIRQITGRDLFKGVFEGVRPDFQNLVDFLSSPEHRAQMVVLGEQIGAVFADMVHNARRMASDVAESIGNLTPAFKEGVIIFTAAAAALTIFVGTVGLMASAIGLIVNPFTLAIAAVAAFATLYIQNFDKIQRITSGIGTFIGGAISTVATSFGTLADGVGNALTEASGYIADFALDVTEWGSNIVGSLADGITQGVGLITSAINGIGDVISFLMAPGSPPRFLPDLDQWGTDSAQTYLDAWGEADFSALNTMGSTIGGLLQSMAGAGKISELSVPQILAGSREAYAQAIDQIVKTGELTEEALNKARKAAGPAGEAVGQQLEAFLRYRNATAAVNSAQENLNAVTQRYKDIITPIRAEMERISEMRTKLSEENEIRNLQRLLSRGGVQESLRQEALARIEEIRTGRKLRGLEKEQDAALDTGNAALEAVKKQQEEAQRLMDLVQQRIQVETESHAILADELRIREQLAKEAERLRKEQERLAKEAERLRKEQLEKQLKIAQLMLAEVKDTVGVFKQQYILADATSTEIERQNAALELQAILGRRIVRNDEAKELGIHPDELRRLREIPVTLEDAGIKAKEAAEAVSDGIRGLDEIDITGPFDELEKAIERVRVKFDETKLSIDGFIDRVDAALPSFLKLRGEGEETAPVMDTLGSAFAGLGAGFLTSKIISIIGGLPALIGTLNPVSAAVIAVVSTLAAAYAGNWFGIREATAEGVTWIQTKLKELSASDAWSSLVTRVETIGSTISSFFLEGGLANLFENNSLIATISTFITETFLPTLAKIGPAVQQFAAILGVLFAPLAEGINLGNVFEVFGNIGSFISSGLSQLPSIIGGAFTNIVTTVRERAPILAQAFLDFLPTIPTRLLAGLLNIGATIIEWLTGVVPTIAKNVLEFGNAFLLWLGPLASDAIAGLGKWLGIILRWIIGTAIPFLIKGAIYLGQALLSFVGWAITNVPPMIADFIGRFVQFMITDGVPMILQAASNLGVALLGFITRSEEEVGPSLSKFLATASSWIATYILPALYSAMLEVGNGVILGLYDAFGQENVDPVLQTIRDVITGIVTFFSTVGTIIGAIFDFVRGITGGIVEAVSSVFTAVSGVVTAIISVATAWGGAIFQFFDDIRTRAEAVVTFLGGLGAAFDAVWAAVVAAIVGVTQEFVAVMLETLASWLKTAIQAAASLQAFLAPATQFALDMFNSITTYFAYLGDFIQSVLDTLGTYPDMFVSVFTTIFSTITTTVSGWLTYLNTLLTTWGGAIVTTIGSFTQMVWDAALALGANIVNGIIGGINSLVTAPQEALRAVLDGLLGFGQDEIEAQSPSELFAREIGELIPAGIAEGVERFDLAPAFRNLVSKAVGIFSNLGSDTEEETDDFTAEGAAAITLFSTNITTTFTTMSELVLATMIDMATRVNSITDELLLALYTKFTDFSVAIQGEQRLLHGAMVSSLVAFGVVFGASMDGVVLGAKTSFEALRPAIVAEVNLMTTDVITLLETPETGFAARLAAAFDLSGQDIGKSLSDGIITGFVNNEALLQLGLETSMARVLASISTNLVTGVTGEDFGVTSSSINPYVSSGPANFLPSSVSNINRETHYHLNVRSEATSQGVVQDYGIMQTLNFDG